MTTTIYQVIHEALHGNWEAPTAPPLPLDTLNDKLVEMLVDDDFRARARLSCDNSRQALSLLALLATELSNVSRETLGTYGAVGEIGEEILSLDSDILDVCGFDVGSRRGKVQPPVKQAPPDKKEIAMALRNTLDDWVSDIPEVESEGDVLPVRCIRRLLLDVAKFLGADAAVENDIELALRTALRG